MTSPADIERESLYDEVWRTPMIELGKKYGVSRPTVKWACLQLNVPLPPQGFWAQVHFGRPMPRADLPRLVAGQRRTISMATLIEKDAPFRRRKLKQARAGRDSEKVRQTIEEEQKYYALLSEVEDWHRAESIRRYLAELDSRRRSGGEPGERFDEWRRWAEGMAERLDGSDLRVRSPKD